MLVSDLKTLTGVRYQIAQLTRDRKPGDGGRWNGYYYTVLGTSGETDEFPCKTNRFRGANSTCSNDIEDSSDIGVYTGLRIRNDCDNTWVAEKIYMEIDGVVQRTIEQCAVVRDHGTVTVEVAGRHQVRRVMIYQYSVWN